MKSHHHFPCEHVFSQTESDLCEDGRSVWTCRSQLQSAAGWRLSKQRVEKVFDVGKYNSKAALACQTDQSAAALAADMWQRLVPPASTGGPSKCLKTV